MSVSFTIICNNCGAKSIVSIEEMVKYEDEEKKFVSRNIIQEGQLPNG